MAEVYIESSTPVKTKIFYGGDVVDPDGDVFVTIYDVTEDPAITPPLNPGTILTVLPTTKLDNDFGTYQVILPRSYTSRQRKFKFVWGYLINSISYTHTTYTDVVTPYANLAEVYEDLDIGTDPSDPNYKTYHELRMAEKYARKVIDNYCNQQFSVYDDIQVAYGAGTDILPLPFKLLEIHEIYANDILLIDNVNSINNWNYYPVISETGFGIRVDRTYDMDNTVYIANGMVPPTANDLNYNGAFQKNVRYRIQGKFGWDKVPDNVEEACVILMRDYFSKDQRWKEKYIKNVQTFDWQFEYMGDAYKGTGNLYADQLLNPYVINGMVVI